MILRAAWVAPVSLAPLRDGFVEIEQDRIVAVGSAAECDLVRRSVLDLGDVVLLPGLVNPHTHLELSCYAGMIGPAPFWTWIERLIELRAQPGQWEREQQAVVDGAWQSLRAGVTCVGDISRRNLAWAPLKQIPIRKVCFVELLSLADQPPRTLAELQSAVAAVRTDSLLSVGVSAHAPYSVPQAQLRGAFELAARLDRPWCAHWCETPEEVAFLRGDCQALPPFVRELMERGDVRSPRESPLGYLDRCAAGLPSGTLAHLNYIADDEIVRLAEAGHVVVYCPRAHRFFGHPPHPFRRLRREGVPVTLGTDSLASNQSLSILDELHFVCRNVADSPSPRALLVMATIKAARALRLEDQIGSLEPGKQADLAAFPCSPEAEDPVEALIADPQAPIAVWVAGRRVI